MVGTKIKVTVSAVSERRRKTQGQDSEEANEKSKEGLTLRAAVGWGAEPAAVAAAGSTMAGSPLEVEGQEHAFGTNRAAGAIIDV